MDIKKSILLVILFVAGLGFQSLADDYYEDDIYYDASKEKKSTAIKPTREKPIVDDNTNYHVGGQASYSYSYPAADTYSVHGVAVRDVDEYNRRGYYAITDTVTSDTLTDNGDFAYTRRIERFHNPYIVSGSDDAQLKEYYYESEPDVNIIINSPGYWGTWYPYNGWSLTFSTSPWYWNSWYYPYWSYSPYWYCGGWYGPAWYPHYHHHYYPGYVHSGYWGPSPVRYGRYNGPGRNGATPGRNGYRSGRGSRPATSASRPGSTSVNAGRNQSGPAVEQPGARPSTTRQNNSAVGSPSQRQSGNAGNYSRPSSTRRESGTFSRPSSGSSRGSFSGGSRGGGSRGGRGGRH